VASSDKTPVTFQELLVSNLASTDALAKLLIEKGVITQREFRQDRGRAAPYQRMLIHRGSAYVCASAACCGVGVIILSRIVRIYYCFVGLKHYEVSRDYFPFIRSDCSLTCIERRSLGSYGSAKLMCSVAIKTRLPITVITADR
jgi:hypothetical protein